MSRNWTLIRGLAREKQHWHDFPEILKKHFPNDSIECLEIDGVGEFFKKSSPTSISEMTEQLRSQSSFLKRNEKTILLAISLGGMIAADWVSRYPNEIEGGIFINSSSSNFSAIWHRLRPASAIKLLGSLLTTSKSREQAVLEVTTNSPNKHDWIQRQIEIQNEHPIAKMNVIKQIWAASVFRWPNKPKDLPFLFMASHNDKLVNASCSKAIAQYWQSPLIEHPWGGHDLPLDDSEWICEQLKNWIHKSNLS